jgi:hypothetical protein
MAAEVLIVSIAAVVVGLAFAFVLWDTRRRAIIAAADATLSARIDALEALRAGPRLDGIEAEQTTHGNHLESLRGRPAKRSWGG